MPGLFDLPPRATKEGDQFLSKKIKQKPKTSGVVVRGNNGGLLERIATINAMVNSKLGKYSDHYIMINDNKDLENYITKSIENGIIAIDTETTSLNPMLCTIAGFSIYTPGMQGAYVPLHHVSYITGLEVENQIDADFASEQLKRLQLESNNLVRTNSFEIIMFNAKFDMRVIKNKLGVDLVATWDGYIAARLLNENEGDGNNNLKVLHRKYCLNGEGDAFTFEDLFTGIPFTHIPIKTGYLYAARDAEITYELYKFQKPFLTADDPICISHDLTGPAFVMHNIEMPLIPVVCSMEDAGIGFDFDFAKKLSEKYKKILVEKEEKFYQLCDMYKEEIDRYRKQSPNNKLGDPISISSPTQLAILLYDILKEKAVDKEKPRGTGEEILVKMKNPLCKAILDYREVAKLISTYIDKMAEIVNPKTNKIHCSFNQYGADTGRFSSSDPNMQNIPSHNKEIRQMFKASDGCVLLSSDYSAQEPRLTAHMSNDEKMVAAYRAGKDLYVEVASIAFGLPYDECKEFRADGTSNPDGKERRGRAKAIVLGVCYGKGVPAIAEDLKISKQLAQKIYDKIMIEFPGLKQFMIDSENMAREKGFVTTVWGRKRRLPKIQLPPYEFTLDMQKVTENFDPLFDEDEAIDDMAGEIDPAIIEKYTRLLDRCYNRRDKEAIRARARDEGISIKDNGGYIAEAVRQCVNSRIQGSAADQTKLAMIAIGNDQPLKDLGFKLLLTVHDELIGECPEENAKPVAQRFAALMVEAAKELSVPSKCDVEITHCWYGESIKIA